MPPGLLSLASATAPSRSPICATTWRRPRIIRWRCARIGNHYDYSYRGIRIDPFYRIFATYGIAHPAQ